MTSRCYHCGDPAPKGWRHCLQCHAYDDLGQAFFGDAGIDEHRLHRGLAYLRGRRHVEPLESLLRKLTWRVAFLERRSVQVLDDRVDRPECELDTR